MATPQADTPVHASAYGCITLPFLVVTVIILAWGARANWNNGQLSRDGHVVQGRIVETRYVQANPSTGQQSSRGGQGRGESAVVEFTTNTGERRTVVSSINRIPPPWKAGDVVDIVYDATNTERADLASEISGWRVWFGIWCAAALVAAAIASLPIAMRIRQARATG